MRKDTFNTRLYNVLKYIDEAGVTASELCDEMFGKSKYGDVRTAISDAYLDLLRAKRNIKEALEIRNA